MEGYLENLLDNPSESSLKRIDHEIYRIKDIIDNYYESINYIIDFGGEEAHKEEIERLQKIIDNEKEFLEHCREAGSKIKQILDEKNKVRNDL